MRTTELTAIWRTRTITGNNRHDHMNNRWSFAHDQPKAISSCDELIHDNLQVSSEVFGLAVVDRRGDVHNDDVAWVVAQRFREEHVDNDERPQADTLVVFEWAETIRAQYAEYTEVARSKVLGMRCPKLST